jgi:hypothetical protein
MTGCSSHYAYVRGVTGDFDDRPVPPNAAICVAISPDAKEWEHNDEIAKDLEKLLLHRGYRTTNSTNADYFLFFEFDRKSMMTRARFDWFGGVQSGMHTTKREGPFDLSLSLRLVRSEAYHNAKMEEFTWAGAAVLAEAPTESRKLVDLLLVAAMETFPEDNGEAERMKLGFYDDRARLIRKDGP